MQQVYNTKMIISYRMNQQTKMVLLSSPGQTAACTKTYLSTTLTLKLQLSCNKLELKLNKNVYKIKWQPICLTENIAK